MLLTAEKNGRPSGGLKLRFAGKQGPTGADDLGERRGAAEDTNGRPDGAPEGSSPSQPPRQKRRRLEARKESDDSEEVAKDADKQQAGSPKVARAGLGAAAAAAAEAEADMSDTEAEALRALRAVDAAAAAAASAARSGRKPAAACAPGGASGVGDWRRALQELRRKRQEAGLDGAVPPGPRRVAPAQLAAQLRQALAQGDFAALAGARFPPRQPDMVAAVRLLDVDEAAQLLKAFAEKHECDPRWRPTCFAWIMQLAEHGGGEPLFRHKLAQQALRSLLPRLEQRLGVRSSAGEALTCLGKWRYIAELAAARRASVQAAASAPGPGAPREGGAAQPKRQPPAEAAAAAAGDADEDEASGDEDLGVGSGAEGDAESNA